MYAIVKKRKEVEVEDIEEHETYLLLHRQDRNTFKKKEKNS